MSTTATRLQSLSPAQAASLLLRDTDGDWARAFLREFERSIAADDLDQILGAWGISASTLARVLGVSRQALSKWRSTEVPPARRPAVADLASATEVLLRYVRSERIAAVVRRPADLLDGQSLLDIALTGDTTRVRDAVPAMFDLRRVAP